MKTIRFTASSDSEPYRCSEPLDQSGDYVKAEVARELVTALERAIELLSEAEETGGYCCFNVALTDLLMFQAALAKAGEKA